MTNNLGPVSSERIKVVENGLANVSMGRIVYYPLLFSLFSITLHYKTHFDG